MGTPCGRKLIRRVNLMLDEDLFNRGKELADHYRYTLVQLARVALVEKLEREVGNGPGSHG